MQATLLLVRGRANRSIVQAPLPLTIGRHSSTNVNIEDEEVSRFHCELIEEDGWVVVQDLGSVNGTRINNRRISRELLVPGDRLTIGPLTFEAIY